MSDAKHMTTCYVCGATVDTLDVKQGGSKDGCQLVNDEWVCSSECWDAVVGPIAQEVIQKDVALSDDLDMSLTARLYHGRYIDRIEELEADLAKAVEFIGNLKQYAVAIDDRHLHGKVVATLAELTGESNE